MSFEPFDVVVVPFPFTDREAAKRRPSLILSNRAFNNEIRHSVMAMITSRRNASWPFDKPIEDLGAAGLPAPSVVRMKLFTLDHRLIQRHIGTLAEQDRQRITTNLLNILPKP